MQYVSRPKIFIQTVKKSPQGCSTSDLLSSKLKNQCEETFIDSLLLSVLITVTCYDSPALSLSMLMQVCFGKTKYFVRILIMWSRETNFILRNGRHVIVCYFV